MQLRWGNQKFQLFRMGTKPEQFVFASDNFRDLNQLVMWLGVRLSIQEVDDRFFVRLSEPLWQLSVYKIVDASKANGLTTQNFTVKRIPKIHSSFTQELTAKRSKPRSKRHTPKQEQLPKIHTVETTHKEFCAETESPALQTRVYSEKIKEQLGTLTTQIEIFADENFQPIIGVNNNLPPTRHERFIEFVSYLNSSDILLPNIDSASEITQNTLSCCLKNVLEIEKCDLLTMRLLLTYMNNNGWFTERDKIYQLFNERVLVLCLVRLAQLLDIPFSLPQKESPIIVGNNVRHTLYDGDQKNLGYFARDGGQFGSIPLYDDYGDEGNPFSHDNEFYDRD